MPAYVNDGYSEEREIPAVDGIHESVSVTYRPLTSMERSQLFAGWEKLGGPARVTKIGEAIVKHVSSWSLMNGDSPVPITKETMSRLDDVFMNSVFELLCPSKPRDEDADAKN